MTDEQIMRALEICAECSDCYDCSYKNGEGGCLFPMHRDALALIKRQREEIEEQKQDIADLNETISNLLTQFTTIRAEAIREFVRRLGCEAYVDRLGYLVVRIHDASIIAKEMTEEQK